MLEGSPPSAWPIRPTWEVSGAPRAPYSICLSLAPGRPVTGFRLAAGGAAEGAASSAQAAALANHTMTARAPPARPLAGELLIRKHLFDGRHGRLDALAIDVKAGRAQKQKNDEDGE